ncbi:unnamed protein product [Acidocella sp. C78]|uniref:L-idonate 5-dehydrogenase n=1 Tax=Acidocella sp. C78 TaxID=1671486 RepID=UPI00191B9049|nr:L-idonate 5-dehydrogenase [Acidocella sp. C78]CAG4910225.1 unnamed protein product [Acidocella sp. C78]
MTAIVIHAAGDLRIEDRPAPPPGPDEVRVRVLRGGICGSDLHYMRHGGFGPVRLAEPMVLGHEVAGEVEVAGAASGFAPGEAVAIDPSLPCGACRFCLAGATQHCADMRFFGSAMRRPHINGAFRSAITVPARQLVRLPAGLSVERAAFAEPLAVGLHAAARAGIGPGMRVIIAGMGPIGLLALLAARHRGAAEIVACDVLGAPLALAARLGATETVDLGQKPEGLARFAEGKGRFDAAIEASGAAASLAGLIAVVRPQGRIVQLGLGGDMTLPLMALVSKEIELAGAFRFGPEFAEAVALLASGAIDPDPLLSAVLPAARAAEAFALAADKARAVKVQLAF